MDTFPSPLVGPAWLEQNLDGVVLADVRWSIPQGPHRDEYLAGHLPGAIFVDLDEDLSDPPGRRGRHPLPSAEDFTATRARLGLEGRPVVAYDDRGGAVAGRLWWMLDALGLQAAVLDGGMQSWSGPIETGWQQPVAVGAEHRQWPSDRFVQVDDVLAAIKAGGALLDARSGERFAGFANKIDSRPGHIPGAISRPWQENLDEDGRFHKADDLRNDFQRLGVSDGTGLIASCGSGVTGCHILLAARVAGLSAGQLYTGSWSEWSESAERPVATTAPTQPGSA